MRIQLSSISARSQRDEGAIAVFVAVCAILLLGMAAFAVDFGNAFANKRQLSVAADASALAAARAVNATIPVGGTCNAAALQATAQSAAETSNAQNDLRNDSVVTGVDVSCTDGLVEVTVRNERSVPSFFGGVFGANGYTPTGTATAQLFVPSGVSGLRPIAACQASLLANYQPAASPAVANPFLVTVSNASAVCGTASSGDWGFTNFLEQGGYGEFNQPTAPAYNPGETCAGGSTASGGNAGCQAQWTDDGYGGPVYFPNSAVGGDTGLGGNTGLANSSAWRTAFDALVDKTIMLPVADRYYAGPGIDRINVTGVVTVKVCAVKRGSTPIQGTSPDCAGRRLPTTNPDLATWNGYKANEGGLWVIPVTYATSGVVDPRAGCDVGEAGCDFGTRAVRLFR